MKQSSGSTQVLPIGYRDVMSDILRQGAQQMLANAIETEVTEYPQMHAFLGVDESAMLALRITGI